MFYGGKVATRSMLTLEHYVSVSNMPKDHTHEGKDSSCWTPGLMGFALTPYGGHQLSIAVDVTGSRGACARLPHRSRVAGLLVPLQTR